MTGRGKGAAPVRKADLVFVDELPGGEAGGGRHQITAERVEAMRENMNRWLQWPSKSTSSTVAAILRPYQGKFEVCSRKVEGVYVTFARCVSTELQVVPDDEAFLGPTITCQECDEKLPCQNANDKTDVTVTIAEHFRQSPDCKKASIARRRRTGIR